MSAVILEAAEPLLKQHGKTPERAKAVIMLVVAGCNKALLPPEKQPALEKEIIDHLVPEDGSAEATGVAVDIMDTAGDRREKLFPDLRKIIVDHEVEISGGRLTLNVTSAPVSDLGRGGAGRDAVLRPPAHNAGLDERGAGGNEDRLSSEKRRP